MLFPHWSFEQYEGGAMSVRSLCFLLAMLAATTASPGAMAQEVIAPAPGPVGVSSTPRPADSPAAPGPAAAESSIKDASCPEGGEGAPLAEPAEKRRPIPLEASWD